MNGVTFGDKHCERDWGIFLMPRPSISPPSAKTVFVELPGGNGQLDLSDSLTGDIAYDTRTIQCHFLVKPPSSRWSAVYSEVMDYLHGKRMKIVFDEDPNYYYVGRVEVNQWESDRANSTLTIDATCDPFKYECASSLEDWKWDPFCFEDGVIREYADLRVDGTYTLMISGSRKPIVPTFLVTPDDGSGLQVTFEGKTYSLQDGSSRAPDLVIREGEHELLFTGNGTVSVDYRGGRL